MPKPTYPAIFVQRRTGEISVSFPDFPGVTGAGESPDAAAVDAAERLTAALEKMLLGADGEVIPQPSKRKSDRMIAPSARIQAALLFRWHLGTQSKANVLRTLKTSWSRIRDLETAGRNVSIDRVDEVARALGYRLVLSYEPLE